MTYAKIVTLSGAKGLNTSIPAWLELEE